MTKEALITKDASFEQFFSFILEQFDQELVVPFIETGNYDTDFETLDAFLRSELITERLKKQWELETSDEWRSRPVELLITETLDHYVTNIMGNIENYFDIEEGDFKDLDADEVKQIRKNTKFLEAFFNIRFQRLYGQS